MAKELVLIVISCAVWGPLLSRKSVLFRCDNTGVVAAVKKGSAKEPLVMHLLRTLWFFVAHFDVSINIEHVPGMHNGVADTLSHNNTQQFFLLNQQADLLPTPIPEELQQILSVLIPDWTSRIFNQLFSATISKV
jgi:predicted ATP-grasp superfamily ATP-dependent carboligase